MGFKHATRPSKVAFGLTAPLSSANAYSVNSGSRPHPAVLGQAPSILAVQSHTPRADRKFRLTILAMSRSAAPSARLRPLPPRRRLLRPQLQRRPRQLQLRPLRPQLRRLRRHRLLPPQPQRLPPCPRKPPAPPTLGRESGFRSKARKRIRFSFGDRSEGRRAWQISFSWNELPKKHTYDEIIRAPLRLPRDD